MSKALDILEQQAKRDLVDWADMDGWCGTIEAHKALEERDRKARETLRIIEIARAEIAEERK